MPSGTHNDAISKQGELGSIEHLHGRPVLNAFHTYLRHVFQSFIFSPAATFLIT